MGDSSDDSKQCVEIRKLLQMLSHVNELRYYICTFFGCVLRQDHALNPARQALNIMICLVVLNTLTYIENSYRAFKYRSLVKFRYLYILFNFRNLNLDGISDESSNFIP